MESIELSLIAFGCILGGILLASVMRSLLPEYHLSGDTKDVVRLGSGLIGTIAALVLGLLIASAKNSYDTQNAQVRQMTANIILLDLLLAEYGAGANEIRAQMRGGIVNLVDSVWRGERKHVTGPFTAASTNEAIYAKIQGLSPETDAQRSLHARAIQTATEVAQARLLLFAQQQDAIPMPFLLVLIFWLTIIFMSFTLFAQTNPVILGALLIFAVSATGAIYLILELSQPFTGLLHISSEPLRNALAPLAR